MSPLERLNEKVDDSTTRETNGECVVIGITKRDNSTGLLAAEDCESFGDDCAFHATTAHGTDDFAVFIDCHCGTGTTGARALDVDNASKGNALARSAPAINVIKKVTHG